MLSVMNKCGDMHKTKNKQNVNEEEAYMVLQTWREVKAMAENRVHWHCFMEALCP
jgi:hypothetical protein